LEWGRKPLIFVPSIKNNKAMAKQIPFEEVTLRSEISSRGGGIEIDLTRFGFKGEKMTAYQNYLGGGLLGRVMADSTAYRTTTPLGLPIKPRSEKQMAKLKRIEERLKQYFHSLTNPDTEWEGQSYEKNQRMPGSAY
jgi:hypothetical protein